MAHIGLLLACEHYPDVPEAPVKLDRQLSLWLSELGHEASSVASYRCYDCELPQSVSECDVWIVSGAALNWRPCNRDLTGLMLGFLKGAAAAGVPILGLHHGEHLVHQALAAVDAPAPDTSASIRAIRNPFASFQSRDRLFAFVPSTRSVAEQVRPRPITLAGMFEKLGWAA